MENSVEKANIIFDWIGSKNVIDSLSPVDKITVLVSILKTTSILVDIKNNRLNEPAEANGISEAVEWVKNNFGSLTVAEVLQVTAAFDYVVNEVWPIYEKCNRQNKINDYLNSLMMIDSDKEEL